MTNKELIDSLTKYFMKQDVEVVARSLAGCLIDLNRVANLDDLPQDELERLFTRLELNDKQLQKFADGGNDKKLKLSIIRENGTVDTIQ